MWFDVVDVLWQRGSAIRSSVVGKGFHDDLGATWACRKEFQHGEGTRKYKITSPQAT